MGEVIGNSCLRNGVLAMKSNGILFS